MRKSFSGLCGIVINELGKDLMQGDAFLFINRRRTMVKMLTWDRTGFVIYYKKLTSGSFEIPADGAEQIHQRLTLPTLMMMLEGVEMRSIKMRKRYSSAHKKSA